jgi:hypothetical protein
MNGMRVVSLTEAEFDCTTPAMDIDFDEYTADLDIVLGCMDLSQKNIQGKKTGRIMPPISCQLILKPVMIYNVKMKETTHGIADATRRNGV